MSRLPRTMLRSPSIMTITLVRLTPITFKSSVCSPRVIDEPVAISNRVVADRRLRAVQYFRCSLDGVFLEAASAPRGFNLQFIVPPDRRLHQLPPPVMPGKVSLRVPLLGKHTPLGKLQTRIYQPARRRLVRNSATVDGPRDGKRIAGQPVAPAFELVQPVPPELPLLRGLVGRLLGNERATLFRVQNLVEANRGHVASHVAGSNPLHGNTPRNTGGHVASCFTPGRPVKTREVPIPSMFLAILRRQYRRIHALHGADRRARHHPPHGGEAALRHRAGLPADRARDARTSSARGLAHAAVQIGAGGHRLRQEQSR